MGTYSIPLDLSYHSIIDKSSSGGLIFLNFSYLGILGMKPRHCLGDTLVFNVLVLRCDGSVIPAPSIWAGQKTPNINGENRFLRGGPDSLMLEKQEDSVQDHTHGIHDPGHGHRYDDKYTAWRKGYTHPKADIIPTTGDKWDVSHERTSSAAGTNVAITSVVGARTDSETRPKNLRVVYIMKIL